MEATVEQDIAYQIKLNREARRLTQSRLASMIGTKQSAVCRYEDPTYGAHSIPTLIKIANAFDCALSVRLISYKELARQSAKSGKSAFLVPKFSEELNLIEGK